MDGVSLHSLCQVIQNSPPKKHLLPPAEEKWGNSEVICQSRRWDGQVFHKDVSKTLLVCGNNRPKQQE